MTDQEPRAPRVSIGLPVYNGERYLVQAIDSILSQTFTDIELIISDNASTDSTEKICREYARKDPRVRYSRNDTNIGGSNNTNLTFKKARGEYFRWAAHDDVFAPELVERCVEVLDRESDVVLCFVGVIEIDEHGKRRGLKVLPDIGKTPFARFRFLSSRHTHTCEPIYGLIRSDVLRRTRLLLNYTDSDRVLLCELGFYGRFAQVPELLFYKRLHPGNYYQDWRGRMAWFDPSLAQSGKITFPNWIQFQDYLATLERVNLTPQERVKCYAWLFGPWLLAVGRGKSMVKDVLVAGYMLTRSAEWRKQLYGNQSNWS
jgi:glycosyltransferase involved in cell wall biosynthesis